MPLTVLLGIVAILALWALAAALAALQAARRSRARLISMEASIAQLRLELEQVAAL